MGTDPAKVKRNATAFHRFVSALTERQSGEAGLAEARRIPGTSHVPPNVPLLVGKATRSL